jgi:hypothetical protein
MEMTAASREQRLFFATGHSHGDGLKGIDGLALLPVALAKANAFASMC